LKKVLTIILDGFGINEQKDGNAIMQAETRNFDKLMANYPNCSLHASEGYVGLPNGQFGNSEVGHMSIGAGRKLKQDGPRIDEYLENKDILKDENILAIVEYLKQTGKTLHVIGLLSDGGVHSNFSHIKELLNSFDELGISKIKIHAITDGRDTSPSSAINYLKEIEELKIGNIATICGRYYAMDRDNKWERTKKYYELIVRGIGVKARNVEDVINACYKKEIFDEFVPPISIDANGSIMDGDVVFWFNYRNDRARQILMALTDKSFKRFMVKEYQDLKVLSFYPQEKNIKVINLLEDVEIVNPLGVYLSKLGLTQARIAETEKYAHVTYFFDGGSEEKLEGCDKFLIPSPNVATYDLKPEMSAVDVTKRCVACMEEDYDFIFMNFANPDMVGHTGDMEATIKAVMAVDICLGKLLEVAEDNFYTVVVMSDHGNADMMLDESGNMITTHTINKVPFVITDKKLQLKNGDLTNVAPTILNYMDIAIPKEMSSKSLIVKDE